MLVGAAATTTLGVLQLAYCYNYGLVDATCLVLLRLRLGVQLTRVLLRLRLGNATNLGAATTAMMGVTDLGATVTTAWGATDLAAATAIDCGCVSKRGDA